MKIEVEILRQFWMWFAAAGIAALFVAVASRLVVRNVARRCRCALIVLSLAAVLLAQKGSQDSQGEYGGECLADEIAVVSLDDDELVISDGEPSEINIFFTSIAPNTNGVTLGIGWTPQTRFVDDLLYLDGSSDLTSGDWVELGCVDVRAASSNITVCVDNADFPDEISAESAMFIVRGEVDLSDRDLDSDGDGVPDIIEEWYGTDPGNRDSDGDGVDDYDEIVNGSDPLNSDTDGDGVDDGDELDAGTDPFFAPEVLDVPDSPHFELIGENVYTTVYDSGAPTRVNSGNIDFYESWEEPYVKTGTGQSFKPLYTGFYTFKLQEADDEVNVTIGDCEVTGSWQGEKPATTALLVAGRTYPISARVENYGGPAQLTLDKFGEFTPVPGASLSAKFTNPVVIFENVRDGRPGVARRIQSTKTKLSLSVNGGQFGGELSFIFTNGDKLRGLATYNDIFQSRAIAPGETFAKRIPYQGRKKSDTKDDVELIATFTEAVTGAKTTVTTCVTVIEMSVEAEENFPTNKNRHVFGIKEYAEIAQSPKEPQLSCYSVFAAYGAVVEASDITSGIWHFTASTDEDEVSVNFCSAYSAENYSLKLHVIAPQCIKGKYPRLPSAPEIAKHPNLQGQTGFANGESGVVMAFRSFIYPNYVNFRWVVSWEGECDTSNRSGMFENTQRFPEEYLRHSVANGAVDTPSTDATGTNIEWNELKCVDLAGGWADGSQNISAGSYELHIPVYWTDSINITNGVPTGRMSNIIQKITSFDDGSMKVEKCGVSLKRFPDGRIEQ